MSASVDETEPISVQDLDGPRRTIDPWKILACVSTAVSAATIATLVWTVNTVSDEETPAERMSAAAGVTVPTVVPSPPAPSVPVPEPESEPVAPAAPVAQSNPAPTSLWQQYFPMQGSAPAPVASAPAEGPWTPGGGLPPVNFASLPAPNIMVNPGFSIDAIIGAVTGTAGWVGGGTLNLLGDAIVASAMNNGGELHVTKIPPPQWPRELDVTKIPPPQWPRELDITKIPPPHVHWDRLLPRF
ncbi:Uncharacterised protein [Mycolicibacterium aurum]|uniref:Uncharacterized protein n=1 Tax=Mycolicibacterium aurum TaxID=1791 RepID=A0A448IHN1_MYCAU|nr:Uncharacterised protein [Mycolicibacterium aurum]